ncbi:ABC transporter permease [Leptotrichia sp. OH3620_COT-345]|uniref:ABC transporter permease n=1 Tax=Leptotrichia sp. OH3620_COT-345 TaxID=2491048 RepID=UPI000F6500BA|nr:ABC transporter permease [Leptotrichia sp. OH3620_COT-345]RRD40511.1 ABC transporter permease [Leptotrichia sp. OH3620_COT-345]
MRYKLLSGGLIFLTIILFIFLGPVIYPVNPNAVNLMNIENPPNITALLGTDSTGRDILARLMEGGKVSLTVGILATLIKMLISLILGFLSVYFEKLDSVIMRICDILMCFPFYVLAISISAFTGPSVKNLIMIIVFFTFAVPTRLIRTEIKTLKNKEFIQILKLNDEKTIKILINHIIPNLKNTVLVIFTTSVAQAILMESSLSFLGMGVQEPRSSWGSMLSIALNVLNIQNKLWLWLPPGILVLLLIFSINLIGEGLRDVGSK